MVSVSWPYAAVTRGSHLSDVFFLCMRGRHLVDGEVIDQPGLLLIVCKRR